MCLQANFDLFLGVHKWDSDETDFSGRVVSNISVFLSSALSRAESRGVRNWGHDSGPVYPSTLVIWGGRDETRGTRTLGRACLWACSSRWVRLKRKRLNTWASLFQWLTWYDCLPLVHAMSLYSPSALRIFFVSIKYFPPILGFVLTSTDREYASPLYTVWQTSKPTPTAKSNDNLGIVYSGDCFSAHCVIGMKKILEGL